MTQDIVPQKDVTIELPVIIVRRSAVVFFTGFKHAADLFDEDSFFLFRDGVFPFLWRLVRVQILQLLRCDEEDLIRKVCPQITVQSVNVVVEIYQRVVQCRNSFIQKFY